MVPLSILDLSPVPQGMEPGQALRNTRDLARHAERWGYNRYWLAEHHNMVGIASAATSVVIGYVAEGTSTIRVGAGGVMLPNHSPLVIAEQFGTLAALFPGRIDLGLGRAPGSDGITARALRRDLTTADTFPQDVMELQHYFEPAAPGQAVQAVPGAGLDVPLWILGSSLFGAQLAAALGLPYAFASHFAPAQMRSAVEIYRRQFRPSAQLEKPYVMLGLNVFVADTRRRGSPALHLGAAAIHQSAARNAGQIAAAHRRSQPCLERVGSISSRSGAVPICRRLARNGATGARKLSPDPQARRGDGDGADLRRTRHG